MGRGCAQANCFARIILVEGEKKIVIYSKVDIPAGSEITYDYKVRAGVPRNAGRARFLIPRGF